MTNGRPTPDDLISAYHDGELSAADRQVADRLLEESADLRTELEDYRALKELLRSSPAENAPAGLRAAVLQRISQETQPAAPTAVVSSTPRRLSRKSLLGFLAGGLAAAAGLVIAIKSFETGSNADHDRTLARTPSTELDATHPESMTSFGTAPRLLVEEAPEAAGRSDLALSDSNTAGGMSAAGAQASLHNSIKELRSSPDGFGIGEVVRFLEQTADGDVLVVEATVVDVRTAMNELQVLLTKNSIQTVPVDFDTSDADKLAAIENTNSEFAVYVESDPIQLNNALAELGRQTALPQQFVEFELAGVLNSPASLRSWGDAPAGNAASNDYFDRSQTTRGALGSSAGQGTAADRKQIRPQSRFSVPSEPLGLQPAPTDSSSGTMTPKGSPIPTPDAAEPDFARRAGTLNERESAPAAPTRAPRAEDESVPPAAERYGYQTVVEFSKDELRQQLRSPSAEAAGSAPRQDSFFADPASSVDLEKKAVPSPASGLQLEKPQLAQQVRRKLRLLVVLEPQQAQPKLKATAPPPVEAPQPPRKKG